MSVQLATLTQWLCSSCMLLFFFCLLPEKWFAAWQEMLAVCSNESFLGRNWGAQKEFKCDFHQNHLVSFIWCLTSRVEMTIKRKWKEKRGKEEKKGTGSQDLLFRMQHNSFLLGGCEMTNMETICGGVNHEGEGKLRQQTAEGKTRGSSKMPPPASLIQEVIIWIKICSEQPHRYLAKSWWGLEILFQLHP